MAIANMDQYLNSVYCEGIAQVDRFSKLRCIFKDLSKNNISHDDNNELLLSSLKLEIYRANLPILHSCVLSSKSILETLNMIKDRFDI